jgi:hypothetical protein
VSAPSPPCACGCCAPQDPQVVTNPPGLSTISDRVEDFAGFRRALLRPLEGEQALAGWAPAAGDLGLQVLEWWAYLGDVLTFYNEQIANASYLRTAKNDRRVADLVALIGYVPTPGIAATGQLAALRTARHANEPLTLPAAMPIASTATAGVPSQVFETQGEATFEGPSQVPVTLEPDDALELNSTKGPASVLLSGKVAGVKAGEQLLLVEQGWSGSAEDADENWSWVTVASVEPALDPGTGRQNTLVTFATAARFGPRPESSLERRLIEIEHETPEKLLSGGDLKLEAATLGARTASPSGETVTPRERTASPPGKTATPRDLTGSAAAPREESAHLAELKVSTAGATKVSGAAELSEFDRGGAIAKTIAGERIGGIYWHAGQSPPATIPSRLATQYQLLRPTQTAALWSHSESDKPASEVIATDGTSAVATVHLGASVRAIVPGELVLLDGGAAQAGPALGLVSSTTECLWTVPYPPPVPEHTPPDIVIAHTELEILTQSAGTLETYTEPATIALRYGFREVGTIIGTPTPSLTGLAAKVGVPPSWSVPGGGCTAILQDTTGTGVLVEVTSAGTGEVLLEASEATPSIFPKPLLVPLRLLLNLLPVSRGSTVASETLGSGNAALASQSFTLQRSPLTYLSDGSGVASTLVVYVDGTAWSEVRSFYGQTAGARVYTVALDSEGTATVTFGDGVNGARLNSGAGNVVATYRYGSGAASPPQGRLTTVTKPQLNLASLVNPVAVFGGVDAQSPEDVRQNAPASVFTFGRAISGLDYEVVASQAAGVSRVSAVWGFDAATQRTAVTVYVGDGEGALAAARKALAGAEDPNRPVAVLPATPVELTISCKLVIAADRQLEEVQAAAVAAIADPTVGLFSAASLGIGERLYRSRVDAALMVDGVLAVHELVLSTGREQLEEVLDPGAGAYFSLSEGGVSIAALSAGAGSSGGSGDPIGAQGGGSGDPTGAQGGGSGGPTGTQSGAGNASATGNREAVGGG